MNDSKIRILEFNGIKERDGILSLDVKTRPAPWSVKPFRTQKERREWQRLLQKDAAKRDDFAC